MGRAKAAQRSSRWELKLSDGSGSSPRPHLLPFALAHHSTLTKRIKGNPDRRAAQNLQLQRKRACFLPFYS